MDKFDIGDSVLGSTWEQEEHFLKIVIKKGFISERIIGESSISLLKVMMLWNNIREKELFSIKKSCRLVLTEKTLNCYKR